MQKAMDEAECDDFEKISTDLKNMITDKTHSDKHDGNGNVMSCNLKKIKQVSRARQGNKLSTQETPNSVARSLTTGYRTRFGSASSISFCENFGKRLGTSSD